MEYEVIIKGTIETKDVNIFMEKFNSILKETNSSFKGTLQAFEFTEFKEILEKESINSSITINE